jgi:hypothetical protein
VTIRGRRARCERVAGLRAEFIVGWRGLHAEKPVDRFDARAAQSAGGTPVPPRSSRFARWSRIPREIGVAHFVPAESAGFDLTGSLQTPTRPRMVGGTRAGMLRVDLLRVFLVAE